MVYTFTAEALNRVRKKITTEIKNQLDAKNLNATRRLRNSVSGTVFASAKSISLNIYAAEYFDSVDKGTKPGTEDEIFTLETFLDPAINGFFFGKIIPSILFFFTITFSLVFFVSR